MLSTSPMTLEIIFPVEVFSIYLTERRCKCQSILLRRSQTVFSPTKEIRYSQRYPEPALRIKTNTRPMASVFSKRTFLGTKTSSIIILIDQGKTNPERLVMRIAIKAKKIFFLLGRKRDKNSCRFFT